MQSCENVGITVENHFREVTKMVQIGSGATRKLQDFMLTGYACYLIAQNGEESITNDHIDNNLSVRGMLNKRGIKPENLKPAEDLKKLESYRVANPIDALRIVLTI